MAAAPNLDVSNPVRLREQLSELALTDLSLLNWQLSWKSLARRKQLPPPDKSWSFYGIKSGRGFGKTLAAANWLGIEGARDPGSYNFVVAPTHQDLDETCFDGPTGLLSVIPPTLVDDYNKSDPSITLYNGSYFRGYAAQAPDRLRGPQSHRGWCDEVASWRDPTKAWDNLLFGLRLGHHPQILWTGTPKPIPFMRMLVKLGKSIIVDGSTYENSENLPDAYYENVAKYEGTVIGRQELYGELIDPEEAGFVKRSDWRLWPAGKPMPKFKFIVMSLDTALTEKQWDKKEQTRDPTACTVWGVFEYDRKDHVMLLDAWEDHLGFPALCRRTKLESAYTYGDSDEPILRSSLIAKAHRPSHQGRKPDMILIEEKSSGISLIQQLADEGVMCEPYNPGDMDKLSRLHAVSPCFPHGRVWALESRKRPKEPVSWAEPVISQVCTYVGEGSLSHEDLLDTTTQALLLCMHRFRMRFVVRTGVEEQVARAAERLNRGRKRNPYDGRG